MKLTLIAASAGTGKTHALVEAIAQTLAPPEHSDEGATRPEAIMAMSYTRASAAELRSRCAGRLHALGRPDLAAELGAATFGTVHSVAGRIARRYAIAMGRSTSYTLAEPHTTARLFEEVLGATTSLGRVDPGLVARVPHLLKPPVWPRHGDGAQPWLTRQVRQLVVLAQAHAISPAQLHADGEASVEELLEVLPPPEQAPAIEARLLAAIERAKPFVSEREQKIDKIRWYRLNRVCDSLRNDAGLGLSWRAWLDLLDDHFSLAEPKGKSTDGRAGAFAELRAAARAYARHPLFHQDAAAVTRLAFELAAEVRESYASLKDACSLVDYGDLEVMALSALERDDVKADLAEQIDLLVVDEFQDTSPIQLAIFTKLLPLARQTIWVGDPKQAIYGFRGATSALLSRTRRALDTYTANSSGTFEVKLLNESWRSPQRMLDWLNGLFKDAFTANGIGPSEVEVKAAASTLPEASDKVATFLRLEAVKGKLSGKKSATALAIKIKSLLNQNACLIRATGALHRDHPIPPRPVGAGDIAILCRNNAQCRQMALALIQHDIAARVDLPGLLASAEGQAVQAALAVALRPACRQAQARLARWCGDAPIDAVFVERVLAHSALPLGDSVAVAAVANADLVSRSPAAAVEGAIACLGLHHCADSDSDWKSQQLTANLGALRALATRFEMDCAAQALPAHLSDFFYHLQDLARSEKDYLGQVDRPAADPSSDPLAEQAVTVTTIHGAKGLDWPVVFLMPPSVSESRRKSDLFGPHIVSQKGPLDLAQPLADSHLRMLALPLEEWREDCDACTALESSDFGKARLEDLKSEDLRLLYVGMTRAKDHLFLATPYNSGRPETTLFDCLRELVAQRDRARGDVAETTPARQKSPRRGKTRPTPDRAAAPATALTHRDLPLNDEILTCAGDDETNSDLAEAALALMPLLAKPDNTEQTAPKLEPLPLEVAGSEIVIGPTLWSTVLHQSPIDPRAAGELMHAFLPAALRLGPGPARAALAHGISERWALAEVLTPATLEASADALAAFLADTFPKARLHFELPFSFVPKGEPCDTGIIDLLVEHEGGMAIIDHKVLLRGPKVDISDRLVAWARQLSRYKSAAQSLGMAKTAQTFIHLPLQGTMIRLGPSQKSLT